MTGVSVSGSSSASSSVEAERCVSGSNRRMDSISSPKNSTRTGRSISGRVDVQDAAAQRDLAGHLDDIHPGVADREQMLDQHLGQILFAALQVQRKGSVVVARKEPHAGGFDRRDDEAGVRRWRSSRAWRRACSWISGWGERFSNGSTSCAGRRRTASAASAPVSSQAARTAACSASAALLSATRISAGRVRRAREERKIQRAGGEGESGDTSSPAAGAQMAADTLKGHRVLKVRKQLRGRKGKIIAALSLPAGGGAVAG